jgi:Tfp pilus assembly protein PilN
MAQINLAPGSQYLMVVRRRRRMIYGLAFVLAVAMFITGVVLKIMVSSANRDLQSNRQELQSVEAQISQASEEVTRIQLFEGRLSNISELLKHHRTWSPYLQELERLLPPATILASFKGNFDSRTIELTGTTSNIDMAAQTLASLQNQPGSSVPGGASHTTLLTSGTISNVEQVLQTGAAGEILGQRYKFSMTLTY